MIYFALTRNGYDDLIAHLGRAPSPLWVNNGVLSRQEIRQLHEAGIEISNFTVDINAQDRSDVAQAVDTIREHHPGHSVWVEQVNGL